MAFRVLVSLWLTCAVTKGASLRQRAVAASSMPAPLSVPPTSNWEGIDGSWNSFAIRVGSPPQVSRGFVSTASQQTWLIHPKACEYFLSDQRDECSDQRGGLYYSNKSSTSVSQGVYQLWIERNLNYTGNAQYGYDNVGLGYVGEGMPTLRKQIVGALAVDDFWFGHVGLHPKTTNFTNITENVPSYLTTLYTEKLIPSVSWGYTAGAIYRFARVQASLTLGGYDKNRFVTNGVRFSMNPDTDRDLLVYIDSITTSSHSSDVSLLPDPIYSFMDSTVPDIWLPIDACAIFEREFGLTWDNATQLYFVNETQHKVLIERAPNVTISLASTSNAKEQVRITLPYAAFDLTAKPPYRTLQKSQRYFPLRRAMNDTQYTLGRVFFQEAYLFADWERQYFTVSQCAWTPAMQKSIVTVSSIAASSRSSSSVSSGMIAGTVVGVVLLLAALVALFMVLQRKRRAEKRKEANESKSLHGSDTSINEETTMVIPKHELDASESPVNLPCIDKLIEAPDNVVHELPGDVPREVEADGRELSEKEAIRAREHRYNGTENLSPCSPDALVSPLPPTFGPSDVSRSVVSSEHGSIGRSPVSPVSNATLEESRHSVMRRRVDPAQVLLMNSAEADSAAQHTASALPGELLEGSNGWSALSERSDDSTSHHRRFSFER